MRDLLVFLPACIAYLIFKGALFPAVPVPDVPLLVVFYIGYTRSNIEGALLSFAIGYVEDAFTSGVLGATSFAFVAVFLAVCLLAKKVHFSTPAVKAASAAALGFLKAALVYLVLKSTDPDAPFLWGSILQALVTGAFAPAILTVLERMRALVTPRTFER